MDKMKSRYLVGVLFIAIGIGVFLDAVNVLDFWGVFASWWPLIFVFIGIVQLTNKGSSKIAAIIFIVIGLFLLTNELLDVSLMSFLLPIILILIGVSFFTNRSKVPTLSEDALYTTAIFTGAKVRSETNHFEGGTATAIFGGAEIDLRQVTVAKEGAVVHLTALFGGIELYVPENVRIQITGTPIFGAWEDKTHLPASKNPDDPLLQINCTAVFGGIDIKN